MFARSRRCRWVAPLWAILLVAVTAAGRADEPLVPKGVAAMRLPEGFAAEVVAEPPLVERPMLATFDDRGRLYVCDSAGVNLRGPELAKNPPHSIRLVEDTDGDGRFDKSTVFADKMLFPQGIVWHDGAVYCSSPPSFWKLSDTDGDDVADRREELVTGFANTGVADDMHGGSLGPDGRIYWCAGRFPHEIRRPGGPVIHKGTAPLVLRCKPDGSDVEVVCGSQGNAVGVAFTPEGDMFASGTFLAPNSMGAGLRDALVHCIDGGEYPVRDRVLNEHKRTGDLLPPLTHLGVSAASDLMLCRAGALGEGSRGDLFSAQFNLHKILRHHTARSGATYTCRNEDFLVSVDPDFHPTDVFEDADGSLLVVDTGGWFRIGCPTSQVSKPEVLGAIYRVRRTAPAQNSSDDPRGKQIDFASLSPDDLAKLLSDPRFAVRDRVVAQLAKLGAAAVRALEDVVKSNDSVETKCAAIWALTRIESDAARAAVRAGLDDGHPSVRQAAARSAGLHRDAAAVPHLVALVISDMPATRREAATALGRIGAQQSVPALLEALNVSYLDRFLEHAVVFALIQIGNGPATRAGLELADAHTKRGALIALDQMDGGQLSPELVTSFLGPDDPLLRDTALWVIAHHGDWGRSMLGFFRQWLAERDANPARREELKRQLLAFAHDAGVQELIGETLANASTPADTRLAMLEVMAQTPTARIPDAWTVPLQQALEASDERIVRQAVATLRALPIDKRPLVSRVDEHVDFPLVEKRFAGTRLDENFCVRWQGILRGPADGEYTFFTESDDGSELYIDGKRVVDNSGEHAMREREGRVTLSAGDHDLRLDFIQTEGEAGCRMSWALADHAKEIIPPGVLFHRARKNEPGASAQLEPGLLAEFFELGGRIATFPDLAASAFDPLLLRVTADAGRSVDVRAQAAAAVSGRLVSVEPTLFDFLVASLASQNPPLVRMDAADALGRAPLDDAQLESLCGAVGGGGVLEVPRLLSAFERSHAVEVGDALVAALGRSQGLKSLRPETLTAALAGYPESVRGQADSLVKQMTADLAKQKERLEKLADVLAGGDIQRGSELFFGNKKAICATCHAVQGKGGQIGPDLTRIGAIRTPHDLLEAIVLPSASFARGYEPFNVVTEDGQVLSGIVARETAEAIHVVGTSRVEIHVPRGAVESIVAGTVSIMPEGMDQQLTRQELGDLIEFLHSLR